MNEASFPVMMLALPGIPLIQPGDNLVEVIGNALKLVDMKLQSGDVLVISSKIVSKSEGRVIDLRTVQPRAEAEQLAEETGKDPRVIELVLQESQGISRKSKGVLVTQHRLGFVSANAGIDQSNVAPGEDHILLLPLNPDQSAAAIRDALNQVSGAEVGIVISDTHGRPFRMGNVGVAIGVAGIPALLDLRGQSDLFGRVLKITQSGYADLIASAAHLMCGEGNEGLPVILIRGLKYTRTDGHASDLNRPPEQDLYR
ncbi:MAG TPA: coenzyme F420-0:L-glutamate ligase [Phototrophicaceae bacterium]|nr:coenzyme F420-0:L-glutamate ligase [Phototrophicaceae bacterium]